VTRPDNSLQTPRFCGSPSFLRLPYSSDLTKVDVAVTGLPFDTGSPYRVGCRFGPNALRAISVMLRPVNPYRNVDVFDELTAIDFGDSPVVPGETKRSFDAIVEHLRPVLTAGAVPIGIRGDHAITYPELKAVAEKHGPVSLLLFDAHPDCWGNYLGIEHHAGTWARRAVEHGYVDPNRSIIVGLRGSLFETADHGAAYDLGYEVITMDMMYEMGLSEVVKHINAKLANRKTFLSFDLDILDPAFAPGVQTPEAGGMTSRECLALLRQLDGFDVVGADVVECNPSFDHGQITALAGATVLAEILALVADRRRKRESITTHAAE